jgi:hypothetical protein
METMKELCIYIMIYIVFVFSSKTLKSKSLTMTGDALVGFSTLTTVVCLLSMGWVQLSQLYSSAHTFYFKFKQRGVKRAHQEHRQKVLQAYKGQFTELERHFTEEQAKIKCRKWKVVRDWYIANRIPFGHIKDEIEYLQIIKLYSFKQRLSTLQEHNSKRIEAKQQVVQ